MSRRRNINEVARPHGPLRKVRGGALIDLAREPVAEPRGGLRAQLIALGFLIPGSPDATSEPPEGSA